MIDSLQAPRSCIDAVVLCLYSIGSAALIKPEISR